MVVKRLDFRRQTLPRYQETFVGRHFNKISFILQLRAERFKFFTLRREFLTHVGHLLSASKSRPMKKHHNRMENVLKEHRRNMQQLYNAADQDLQADLIDSPFATEGVSC